MRTLVYSARAYDRRFLAEAAEAADDDHDLVFVEHHLDEHSALAAEGFDAVCAFVNDDLSAPVLAVLADRGVATVAMRCAGFNNVDLEAAAQLGVAVHRVPAYSPYAVAEHTVALMLALNRRIPRAAARVREGNFSLEGLLGFDLRSRRVGIIGTGKIGMIVARILRGFGCSLRAYDPFPADEVRDLGVRYTDLDTLLGECDVVTLHCPLTPDTHHLLDAGAFAQMKRGAMLVNTSRGGLVDAPALVDALKSGQVGSVALDVYEEEGDLFFEDLSDTIIDDDVFARLLTFPNVLITAHQAFFTAEAMRAIAATTIDNLSAALHGRSSGTELTPAPHD